MENIALILFTAIAVPLIIMLLIFKGRSRVLLSCLVVGMFMNLFAGEINGLIFNNSGLTYYFLAVNIIPIVEEIFKILPIILICYSYKYEKQVFIECALSIGVGFAILENVTLFVTMNTAITFPLALMRGFGAGLMHVITSYLYAIGLNYIVNKRYIAIPGIVGLLALSSLYHSAYNIIVQSKFNYLGFALPLVTLIFILIIQLLIRKKEKTKYEEKND